MKSLYELAKDAFIECHDNAYWSDHNPRPPQGHNTDFYDCNDPKCVERREVLYTYELINELEL